MASGVRNILFVAWGTLEILFFGGLVFGWASLVYVFKLDHYFHSGCVVESPVPWNNTNAWNNTLRHNSAELTYQPIENNGTRVVLDLNVTTTDRNGLQTKHKHLSMKPACATQDEHFNLIYTIAVVFTGMTNVINGFLMDRYGNRLCRCFGIMTFLPGAIMLAVSTAETAWLLYPGMLFLSFGGYYFLMTNFQLGNLIPSKRSTIIAMYCGAYDSSAFMMILVKLAYEGGVPVKASLLFLSAIFSLCIVSTFCFLPKMRIPHPLPEGYKLKFHLPRLCRPNRNDNLSFQDKKEPGETLISCQETAETRKRKSEAKVDQHDTGLMLEEKVVENDRPDGEEKAHLTDEEEKLMEKQDIKQWILSTLFILDVIWLMFQRFRSWSYVGMLNPLLTRLANGDKLIVSSYTSVYACLQFFGIFLAPLSGRLMDRKKKSGTNPQLQRIDRVEVCVASFVIDSSVALLLTIACTIPVLEVQYVSFALHVIHRALLYGPNSAFLAQAFPPEHFGKLFGLAMSVAAAFSLLQYPLFLLVQGPCNGDPLVANLIFLVLVVLSFVHPLYIWRWCRRQRREHMPKTKSPIYKPTTIS